ncbi:MAG: hypothetical protein PHW46_06180, partial [Candidatus Omnitrophica bacterium]|nr:hypothetical protein [Candidatus Omnitrophota bacterium]
GVTAEDYKKHLIDACDKLRRYPISFISSKTGKNVVDTLSVLMVLDANLDFKASTPFLNNIFEDNNPSKVRVPRSKKRPNFFYIVQTKSRPIHFKFFVNDPSCVLSAHISFIENRLRDNLPILGIPIKIAIARSRKEKR